VTDKQKDLLDITIILVLEVGWIIYLFVFDGPLPSWLPWLK
jgi:hypothetical protein